MSKSAFALVGAIMLVLGLVAVLPGFSAPGSNATLAGRLKALEVKTTSLRLRVRKLEARTKAVEVKQECIEPTYLRVGERTSDSTLVHVAILYTQWHVALVKLNSGACNWGYGQ